MAYKAPGKHKRKGISLLEINSLFPDDPTSEAWFVKARWRNGPCCPFCGSYKILTVRTRKPMPFRCRGCRKHFSVKTKTIMQGSNLGMRKWGIALYIAVTGIKGVSSMKLHRDLKITQKSAWFLAHRIRENWEDQQYAKFFGEVEVDETYVGGKDKNRHASQIKAGRGPVGKAAVVGAKNRDTNEVTASVVTHTDQETLEGFITERVDPGSEVFTDDHRGYTRLREYFDHRKVRHSVREFVRGRVHTNGIESFWAGFKRGFVGTYHQMSVKHLPRYVNEFCGRHNIREMDTIDQMKSVVRGGIGKRLKYQELIQ